MNISAHDYTNQFFTGVGAGNGGWDLGWSSQKLVTSAIVAATGGTYETRAPEAPEEKPEKIVKVKKIRK